MGGRGDVHVNFVYRCVPKVFSNPDHLLWVKKQKKNDAYLKIQIRPKNYTHIKGLPEPALSFARPRDSETLVCSPRF